LMVIATLTGCEFEVLNLPLIILTLFAV
jgi:hypothetical protein